MKLLRLKHVIEKTGLSRATIYRLQQLGMFPSRRRLSSNAVAWVESDIEAWIAERPEVPSSYGGAGSPLAIDTPLTRRPAMRAAGVKAEPNTR